MREEQETRDKRTRCGTHDASVVESPSSDGTALCEPPAKRQRLQETLVPVVSPTTTAGASIHSIESLPEPSRKIVELNNRAIGLYRKGDFRNASSLFQEAATMRRRALIEAKGAVEKDAPKEPTESAYIYQRMDFDEGMNVFPDAMTVDLADHWAAMEATLLFNAGQARRRMDDTDNARNFYLAALECLLSALAEPSESSSCLSLHRVAIPVLHNLGHLAYRQGHIRKAMTFYERVLKHCSVLSAIDTPTVGFTYNCIGVLYYHMSEENAKARSYLESALFIIKDALGPRSSQVATILNNLGRVHVQVEDFQGAVTYYQQSLGIREECLGPDHLDYAATAFNAGQSLHQLERYDEAIELYNQFLKVATVKFSKQHRDIAVVLSGIAQIYQERQEYDKALKLYEESLVVGREALGQEHPDVAMLLNR